MPETRQRAFYANAILNSRFGMVQNEYILASKLWRRIPKIAKIVQRKLFCGLFSKLAQSKGVQRKERRFQSSIFDLFISQFVVWEVQCLTCEGTQYVLHVGKRLNSMDPFHITLEFLLYASVPVCIEYSLYSSFLEIFEKELLVSILLGVEVAKYFFQKCKLFSSKMKNIFFQWTCS